MNKRGPKKPVAVATTHLCDYGCGKIAKYQNASLKFMCDTSAAKCDAIKAKNSAGLESAYKNNIRSPSDFGGNRGWRKGLDITDPRIKSHADLLRGVVRGSHSQPMSDIGRDNISKGRVKVILEGNHDSSGRKGHRGHYNGIYFHSSWELAYYVYVTENTHKDIKRNMTTVFEYLFDSKTRRYVPDFIVDGEFIEIKGYLHGERDEAKFEQTKDKVVYKFSRDLEEELTYCRSKYGNEFWKKLYNTPVDKLAKSLA